MYSSTTGSTFSRRGQSLFTLLGGLFRPLYADFLAEAATITDTAALAGLALRRRSRRPPGWGDLAAVGAVVASLRMRLDMATRVIPLGIGMALTGNIAGGVFVALFHVIVISNIDNILRPQLVPRSARLQPALMMLGVFAGLGMFGFAGIVFGPVVMIIVVTTVNMYRSVYKGVAWVDDFEGNDSDEPEKRPWWRLVLSLGKGKAASTDAEVPSDESGATESDADAANPSPAT